MPLKALALNCTLTASPAPSSTEKLLGELLEALREYDADGEIVRVVDLNIKPGVSSDEGEGDEWPALRKKVLAADILDHRHADLARAALERRQARAGADGRVSGRA